MKVLIIGGGGREHAILKQVSESKNIQKIYCAPGNPGMESLGQNVAIGVEDVAGLLSFAKEQNVDVTIVGPELPLVLGIVDAFEAEGLKIFGPSKAASILEGSKTFTKEFCERHDIPSGGFKVFSDSPAAKAYILEQNRYPIVIKADGLAAGKGVVIAQTEQEAIDAIGDMLEDEKFGVAGCRVVIEEFLVGEEASFIVVCDGESFIEFPTSQDHKAAYDGDEGPNTGGMGAYTPAPIVTQEIRNKVIKEIIVPTLKGMASEGMPYRGFLYAGLMISKSGDIKLLEYNCRLGDPEAEVILPMLESDFIELMMHAVNGSLSDYKPKFNSGSRVCVVLASEGYPGAYPKGVVISGLNDVTDQDVFVYHAGTVRKDGQFVTNGGRVLTVSAKGEDLKSAIHKVYQSVPKISWQGMQYRTDIGAKGLK